MSKVELGEFEEGILPAKRKVGFVHEDSLFRLEPSVGIETIRGILGYCYTDCKDLKDPSKKKQTDTHRFQGKEKHNWIFFSFL